MVRLKSYVDRLRNGGSGASAALSAPASDEPLFDQPFYVEVTEARLRHLDWMRLTLAGKSVADIGCGIGRLSQFFADQGADVTCVDGRAENIEILKRDYPGRIAHVIDVETDRLLDIGSFDVVFCYGLLYHLADPLGFLRRAEKICGETMILETKIVDYQSPQLLLIREFDDPTMGLHHVACRPSSAYIAACLRHVGMSHVYNPARLPDHADFRYRRRDDGAHMHAGVPMRDIFVASRKPLDNSRLVPVEDRLDYATG
ncbi:MAG: class I SAM-dependent methyltransferase [Candidatus Dormibacteria bacterium]